MNQEESEHVAVEGMKEGADSCCIYLTYVEVTGIQTTRRNFATE